MPSRNARRTSRTFGGFASGAASGAAIGTATGIPILGTIGGALVGGLAGFFSDDPEMDQYEAVKQQIEEGRAQALTDAVKTIRQNARAGAGQAQSSGSRRAIASGRVGETEALVLPGQEQVYAESSRALSDAVAQINADYDRMAINAELGAPIGPSTSDVINTSLMGAGQLASGIQQATMMNKMIESDVAYMDALTAKLKQSPETGEIEQSTAGKPQEKTQGAIESVKQPTESDAFLTALDELEQEVGPEMKGSFPIAPPASVVSAEETKMAGAYTAPPTPAAPPPVVTPQSAPLSGPSSAEAEMEAVRAIMREPSSLETAREQRRISDRNYNNAWFQMKPNRIFSQVNQERPIPDAYWTGQPFERVWDPETQTYVMRQKKDPEFPKMPKRP